MLFETKNFCWFSHGIKGHTWFNACNMIPWAKRINFHSAKIRKKEEGRKGGKKEGRKRESCDYLAQALIRLHYWYLLNTYCMHSKITLSISLWLLTDAPPGWLLPPAFLCEWSSFTLPGSWRCCENWQVCLQSLQNPQMNVLCKHRSVQPFQATACIQNFSNKPSFPVWEMLAWGCFIVRQPMCLLFIHIHDSWPSGR